MPNESKDEVSGIQNPKLYFEHRIVFNNIFDQAISSISERFENTKEFDDAWGGRRFIQYQRQ